MGAEAPVAGLTEFYATLPTFGTFAQVVDAAPYTPLPDGWWVGVADVVDSTGAIAAGRYKSVNLVGASVITAVLNAIGGATFPFVFGGDGAAFAIPGSLRGPVIDSLAALRVWASEEIGLKLRVALLPVTDIRAAGHDVTVARFAAASEVSYAMFSGGGIAWAERQMKTGLASLGEAAPGSRPDLAGLSCRWSPIKAQHGEIVSLLVVPHQGVAAGLFETLVREIVALLEAGTERGGHPVPPEGPTFSGLSRGLDLEVRAAKDGQAYWRKYLSLRAFYLFVWMLFLTNAKAGQFDPVVYRLDTTRNTDFRKFDDGLKLTIDSPPALTAKIETRLEQARKAGIADYGLYRQDSALMTCIVPSPMTHDHMHFVDGAGGGYAKAAEAMKARRQ